MDMYKKKPLKFSGLGRDVRKDELNAARRSSRLQRFSLLRSLEDDEEEIPKENVPSSRIPMIGNQKLQAPSRADMLKRWKNERMMKKKIEEQTKKPVFKVGAASKLQSKECQVSFNKFNRFGDLSKIQSQLSKNPSSSKIAGGMKSKVIDAKFITARPPASGIKSLASSQVNRSKDISKQPSARSQVVNTLPQASKFKADKGASSNLKSQITARPLQKEIIREDYNKKFSKVATTTTTADTKGNKKVPYSGLPKPTTSMLPQRRQLNVPSGLNKPVIKSSNSGPPKQIGMVLRKPDEKPKFGMPPPKKVEKPKLGMTAPKKVAEKPKSEMVPPKKGTIGLAKVQPKKEVTKSQIENKQSIKKSVSTSENQNPMFPCHLSFIEPVEEKSFAPKGFVFRPPIELETSLFLDNGPCAIFARLRNEMGESIRTSTPKQKEWNEYEEQLSIHSIEKTPSGVETSKSSESTNGVPSSEIKFAEPLLLNSSLEIELPVQSSSQIEVSEQDQPFKSLEKINCLTENRQPKPISLKTAPLDEFYPNHNAIDTEISNEIIKDARINCTANQSKICSPIQNEMKESSLLGSPTNDIRDLDLYSSEMDQEKTESCVPEMGPGINTALEVSKKNLDEDKPLDACFLQEKDQRKSMASEASLVDLGSEKDFKPVFQACDAASELGLPPKDQIKAKSDPCLIDIDNSASASSVVSSTLTNILEEEDETGSLSDSVFLSRSDSNGTRGKRFTRSCRQSKKPSLLKISESPEIRKTPKRAGTPKALQKATLGEFTPRRSMRIARLSQLNSEECLFDVEEALYSSPGKDSSRLTYDFDKLHLESGEALEETLHPMPTRSTTARGGKISLLYTPTRTRSSSRLKSYGGDLMAFSPNS